VLCPTSAGGPSTAETSASTTSPKPAAGSDSADDSEGSDAVREIGITFCSSVVPLPSPSPVYEKDTGTVGWISRERR